MLGRHQNLKSLVSFVCSIRRRGSLPMSVRHILSTARAQTPVHFAAVEAVKSDSLNPRVKKSITKAPVIWPKPCMEKTAAIIAPRHLVVANL